MTELTKVTVELNAEMLATVQMALSALAMNAQSAIVVIQNQVNAAVAAANAPEVKKKNGKVSEAMQ
jgi:hypothetical protein